MFFKHGETEKKLINFMKSKSRLKACISYMFTEKCFLCTRTCVLPYQYIENLLRMGIIVNILGRETTEFSHKSKKVLKKRKRLNSPLGKYVHILKKYFSQAFTGRRACFLNYKCIESASYSGRNLM